MRTIVKGKNYEVPDQTRAYAERKMRRLERIVEDPTDAIVELSVERHRSESDSHLVDVSLVIDGRTLRGRAAALSHRAGIDEVVDKLERRAVDHKSKPRARTRPEMERARLERATPAALGAPDLDGIVKVKTFEIEPMFEEDAIVRMEELGHSFFVFVNAEGRRVNVLYRRTAGGYGLIDPVIRGTGNGPRPAPAR